VIELAVEPHERLHLRAFITRLPDRLELVPTPEPALALLAPGAEAPFSQPEELRGQVRDVFRGHGYKPTGRGKPSSEYLARQAAEGLPRINAAVDLCNAVSLHSGIPISVVDPDRGRAPWRVTVAPAEAEYVFNTGGQVIAVGGLLCLFDAEGPCANAVKDAQRTKTAGDTRSTLSLLWGPRTQAEHVDRTLEWYLGLWAQAGAETSLVV